jgi:hypothetical protein
MISKTCQLFCRREQVSRKNARIAIVGGGIAGTTAALLLSQTNSEITLYENAPSLVSGPPFCHLHAGGNLYPEISDAQCITLLEQSIDFARLYPYGVDHRPTIVALPIYCSRSTAHLLPRLQKLTAHYQRLIDNDPQNAVLGDPQHYFKLYERADIEALKSRSVVAHPRSADQWMIPFAKEVDMDKIQFPVILVQEYGLNLFRISAGAHLTLDALPNVELQLLHKVSGVQRLESGWRITSGDESREYDYLINAAGFQTGRIDDMIGVPCERMVEFKAAYVSHWEREEKDLWPEIIFHGERGTPRGMGQFTPYPEGYFQLHGMTKEITLYEDGLVANTPQSCQPKLPENLLEKIEASWDKEEVIQRTQSAIRHLSRFIPAFESAKVGSKPLFGAQQIPGDDPTLRVAEVSFPTPRYARCEIVKVSSTIDMAEAIVEDLKKEGLISQAEIDPHPAAFTSQDEAQLSALAEKIAEQRGYPAALARRCVPA